MSFSYINRFTGSPVQTAYVSYLATQLPADTQLQWPTSYLDTVNVVAKWNDIYAAAGPFTLTLPDATQVSPGQDFVMNNPSAHNFVLSSSAGGTLWNINAGQCFYFILIDNSTADGVWRQSPFVAGAPAVTSVDAISLTVPALTITGGPIVGAGVFDFTLGPDLVGINGLATEGYAVRTGVGLWQTNTIVGGANIAVTNGNGVAGNTTIALDTTIDGLVALAVGNLQLVGNTISSTNPNGAIILNANGNGNVVLTSGGTGVTVIGTININGTTNTINSTNGGNTLGITSAITTIGTGVNQLTIATSGANPGVALSPAGGQNLSLGLLSYPLGDGGVRGAVPISNGTNALYLGIIAAKNMLVNGNFQVWNRGTTFTAMNASQYAADRWQWTSNGGVISTFAQGSMSANNFFAAVGRQAANAAIGTVTMTQSLTIASCNGAAGLGTVSFRIFANAGVNFSGAGNLLNVTLIGGTGNADVSAVTTGFTGQVTLFNGTALLVADVFNAFNFETIAIPPNVTQLALAFSYTTTGAAGAADLFRIANIQMNLGPRVSFPMPENKQDALVRCTPYTFKSFLDATTPAQNIGVNTGEAVFNSNGVAAATIQSVDMKHPVMRAVPSITTFYNPAAANANARNLDKNVDCTAVTIVSNTDRSFSYTTTAGAATVVGDRIGIHFLRDAELY